jgi:putative polyketide hydroxylase
MTVEQATLRLAGRPEVAAKVEQALPLLSEEAVTLGYRYHSSTIMSDEKGGAVAIDAHTLRGEPGTRAPHVWLQRDGATLSSLDLFGRGLVLLTGAAGAGWHEASAKVAKETNVSINCYQMEKDLRDPAGQFPSCYGIGDDGAILLRPDGFVAWRSPGFSNRAADDLRRAMSVVLGR